MSQNTPELEAIITRMTSLSPLEKIRLVEQVMATLERDLSQVQQKPRRSLYGVWSDVNVSADDIDEARREMWGDFPREDI